MKQIEQVLPLLTEKKTIVITTHYKPDGDAVGSSLALAQFLNNKGHNVTVVLPSEIPDFLSWMPGLDLALNYESEPKTCLKLIEDAELIFCLDFNTPSRVKLFEQALREAPQPKVLIDHHLLPEEDYFTYGISIPEKSSTCEMVYDFIMLYQDDNLLTDNIMQCIYAGTLTDTGSFKFPATTASVHLMVAKFLSKGLQHTKVHQHLFDNYSAQRIKFLGYLLHQKMELNTKEGYGIIALSTQEMYQYNIGAGDTENVVNYPLSISGISLSVMLTERKDEIRLSFRSQGNVDVSTFARTYFAGGGHFNAAGGVSKLGLNETILQLKNLITETELTKYKN